MLPEAIWRIEEFTYSRFETISNVVFLHWLNFTYFNLNINLNSFANKGLKLTQSKIPFWSLMTFWVPLSIYLDCSLTLIVLSQFKCEILSILKVVVFLINFRRIHIEEGVIRLWIWFFIQVFDQELIKFIVKQGNEFIKTIIAVSSNQSSSLSFMKLKDMSFGLVSHFHCNNINSSGL